MDINTGATAEGTPAACEFLYKDTETVTWGELYERLTQAAAMPGSVTGVGFAHNLAKIIAGMTRCDREETTEVA